MHNYLSKLKSINTFIFDVDGVLTDGSVMIKDNGLQARIFSIKDGYAMNLAVKKGYRICIITGGTAPCIKTRFENLGIKDIFTGAEDKLKVFSEYIKQNDINPDHISYAGDDMPDYKVMQKAGLPVCPSDAAIEIREISSYISPFKGGEGVARDIIYKVLKLHGKWE